MKTTQIILSVFIIFCLSSCNKNKTEIAFPPAIDTVIAGLKSSFDQLNTELASNVASIVANPSDTAAIRSKMSGLFSRSSFVVEFSFVTPQGIMKVVEPSVYHSIQGSNISKQDHVIQAFNSKIPILTKLFFAVEGFYAAVDIHPAVKNG